MLFKLSLRNARRQARDYLVYFVTIVMAASLLYAFNGLIFSDEIRSLGRMMSSLPLVIVFASIVAVCVFEWLVSYATRFMLTQRSRELGLYILSGITNAQVARLFFLENLAVGTAALFLGMALGGLLYQAMRAVLMSLFGLPYRFVPALSLPAALLTAVYLAVIYLYALRRSRKHIRRMKIYDLIYFDRQNEETVIRTGKGRRGIFFASLVLGVIGTCLLMAGGAAVGLIGAGCIIFFSFGFFISFASGVPAFFDRHPAKKYQGQSLLVFRALAARMATMGIVMAIISVIFTATLLAEGGGFMINGLVRGRAAENACFDLYIGLEGDGSDPYENYMEENLPLEQSVWYSVYLCGSRRVQNYINECTMYYNYEYEQDPVLCWSDYAALRSIAGYPAAKLEPGKYLIHCMTYLEEPLRNYTGTLTVGETVLTPGSVYTEHFHQSYGMANGRGYILVVPDEAAEGLPAHHLACAAKTAEPVTEEQLAALQSIAEQEYEKQKNPHNYSYISTRANEEKEMAAQIAVIDFPLFYVALALTITAAAILTIRQLSETERCRHQFMLLRKLGMDRRDMARTLRNQFAVYYAMPAVPSVLIAVPFILHLCHEPEPGVMTGLSSPAAVVMISLSVFFLIYAVYILLAYTSLKRKVLPK